MTIIWTLHYSFMKMFKGFTIYCGPCPFVAYCASNLSGLMKYLFIMKIGYLEYLILRESKTTTKVHCSQPPEKPKAQNFL